METRADRVLIACRTCGRQYDVTGMAVGSRVRCECGLSLLVEAQRPRQPRPLKCGRCGGPLKDAARKCDYCEAEITLEERGLSGVCPLCYARLLEGARFCMECGVEIAPQALRAVHEGAVCPRCKGGLRSRSIGTTALVECGRCAGIWISAGELERICEKTDVENLVRQHLSQLAPTDAVMPTAGPAYIPCPTCGQLMNRKSFGTRSGVIVDVCKPHGVWLDHRELERIVDFVRAGGLLRAREIEVERLKGEAERAQALWSNPVPEERGTGGYRSTNLLEEVLIALAGSARTWLRS
jgi:Zn-finger nucleic acid-binding protein